jgi:hypothetical protein
VGNVPASFCGPNAPSGFGNWCSDLDTYSTGVTFPFYYNNSATWVCGQCCVPASHFKHMPSQAANITAAAQGVLIISCCAYIEGNHIEANISSDEGRTCSSVGSGGGGGGMAAVSL